MSIMETPVDPTEAGSYGCYMDLKQRLSFPRPIESIWKPGFENHQRERT